MQFNIKLDEAMELKEVDREAAAEVLRIASEYLRSGKQMPFTLALYLANAISASMCKRPSLRGPSLIEHLNLTSGHRRRKYVPLEILPTESRQLLDKGLSVEMMLQELAERYDVNQSTIKRRLKEAIAIEEEQLKKSREFGY